VVRADLDAWRDSFDKAPPVVAQLPATERRAWRQRWGDVQELLDRARATPRPAAAMKP
jgi:hypothetical protein